MAWRYVNPGYSKLIHVRNATNYLSDITDTNKSKLGFAYQNTGSSNYYRFDTLPQNGEYWVKADFYLTATYKYNSIDIYFRDSGGNGVVPSANSDGNGGIAYYAGNYYNTFVSGNSLLTGLKLDDLNTIWIHVKWGTAGEGFLEFQINDKTFDRLQTENFPAPTTTMDYQMYVYHAYGTIYLSNIIISDEEISPKEQVVVLPVSTTENAMTAQEGGIYLADSVGQTLLQTIDASALISQYGADSKVTGIALVGNPAYRTGEQLSSLTAISKSGGVTTERGTSALTEDSATVICQTFSVASDTTIADLQNMQFGWKAGE